MKLKKYLILTLLFPQIALAVEEELPHGIRSDVEIGFRYTNEILWAVGLLALGLLAWFLYQKWKKKDTSEPIIPEEEVHVRLRRELIDLAKMELAGAAEIKEFYFKLSEASRKSLELLGLGAVEQTFEEFKPLLAESHEFPTFMRDEILTVLERAEMVKFAKYVPNTTVCEDDLALCFRQLDRYDEVLKKAEEDVKEEVSLIEKNIKTG